MLGILVLSQNGDFQPLATNLVLLEKQFPDRGKFLTG